MVKLTGPLFSLGASGTIGKTVTYSQWKGRPFARQRVIPHNPKSGGQVGARAMWAFITQNWDALTTAEKATWTARAAQTIISPFNAYTSYNAKRFATFNAPSQEDPAAETNAVGTVLAWTATGGVREVVLDISLTLANANWGVAVFRSTTTGFTPSITNVVFVRLLDSTTAIQIVDTPLDPDTYYYDAKYFTDDGLYGSLLGEINGTST
ncbi:hypothetical protein LCGC14_1389710 [marine sediment metagenome]|uniref:Uncharacterized protein n=1 Tax=marine sediment metagenome TaxID=412755 RepID=A0A0F9KL46_9ZZZZ